MNGGDFLDFKICLTGVSKTDMQSVRACALRDIEFVDRQLRAHKCLLDSISKPPPTEPVAGEKRQREDAKKKLNETSAESSDDISWKIMRVLGDPYLPCKHTISRSIGMDHLNNAGMKLLEMLHEFSLVPLDATKFRAFFNCEFPGSMALATRHYISSKCPDMKTYDWMMSSLVESTDGTPSPLQDRFGLAARFPERCAMSAKNNGDVTVAANLTALLADPRNTPRYQLCVSDGGIDVSEDYNAQERLNAHLHLGQTMWCMAMLASGGNMVVKSYTFFEPYTLALLFCVARCFRSVRICKPVTSKTHNSEVYWVCRGYDQKIGSELVSWLTKYLVNQEKCCTLRIPKDATPEELASFWASVRLAVRDIFLRQMRAISSEVLQFGDLWFAPKGASGDLPEMLRIARQPSNARSNALARAWMKKFQVEKGASPL